MERTHGVTPKVPASKFRHDADAAHELYFVSVVDDRIPDLQRDVAVDQPLATFITFAARAPTDEGHVPDALRHQRVADGVMVYR